MANVRYWQVHVLHTVNAGVAHSIVGVVADTEDEARFTVVKNLDHAFIRDVVDVGHVRFIVHKFMGPDTKVTLNGEPVDAVQAQPQ